MTGVKGPTGPVSSERVLSVARMFEQQNNYQKARQLYHTVLRSSPGHPQATELLANLENARVLGTMPGSPDSLMPNPNATMLAMGGQPVYGQPVYGQPAFPAAAETRRIASPEQQSPPAMATVAAVPTQANQVPVKTVTQSTVVPEQPVATPAATATVTVEATPNADAFVAPIEQPVTEAVAAPTPQVPATPPEFEQPIAPANVAPEAPANDVRAIAHQVTNDETVTTAEMTSPAGSIEEYMDNPEQAIPQIINFLDHETPDVRSLAAFLIGETGWKGAAALPSMKQRLTTENVPAIRLTVAESLAKIDSQSLDAFEVMSESLVSDDDKVRTQAAFGMRVFAAAGHPECVQQLSQALGDPNSAVRTMAALSLGDFGQAATDAIPALRNALNDSSADVRDAASASLDRVDPSAK